MGSVTHGLLDTLQSIKVVIVAVNVCSSFRPFLPQEKRKTVTKKRYQYVMIGKYKFSKMLFFNYTSLISMCQLCPKYNYPGGKGDINNHSGRFGGNSGNSSAKFCTQTFTSLN